MPQALISWRAGQTLKRHQWSGVLLLTAGLVVNGFAIRAADVEPSHDGGDVTGGDVTATLEASRRRHAAGLMGGMLVLVGTVFHAAFWVASERELLKKAKVPPVAMPLLMGVLQTVILGAWNIGCYMTHGLAVRWPCNVGEACRCRVPLHCVG
jgi:drug/metabolite transporter (DMT)-like permease